MLQHSKKMQRPTPKAHKYALPDFKYEAQTNELNPTPPNITTPLRVRVPPMWIHPRAASARLLGRWPSADDYIYKLVMELYVCMQRLLQSIEAGDFNEDTSILDSIDTPDSHYMAMRTDRTTYTGNRYQIVNKDHKEDDIQRNFLLFCTMCHVMDFFRKHVYAYQSNVAANDKQRLDFFQHFAPLFETLRQKIMSKSAWKRDYERML